MMELNWWQIAVLFALWCTFVFAVAVWWFRRGYRRRKWDHCAEEFPHIVGDAFSKDEGMPGGPRGRVWTELERSEYKQARERRKLRIVQ